MLAISGGTRDILDQAEQALAIAREVDDPALLARALTACGCRRRLRRRAAGEYFAEAIGLARELGDRLRLSQILGLEALAASLPVTRSRRAPPPQEGCDLAEAIGDRSGLAPLPLVPRTGTADQGDLAGAVAHFRAVAAEAEAAHDAILQEVQPRASGHGTRVAG